MLGYEAKTLHRLAETCRRSGDLDRAISFAMDGRWLSEKVDAESMQADSLTELGAAHLEKGDSATAKGYAERALALTVRLSALARAGQASAVLAAVHRDQNDLVGAERHARRSVNFCRQVTTARAKPQPWICSVHSVTSAHDLTRRQLLGLTR
jgi:hypothetical protein